MGETCPGHGGAGRGAWELGVEEGRRWPGQRRGAGAGLPEVLEGSGVGLWSPGPSTTRRGGAGAAPERQACILGPTEIPRGDPRGPEGGYRAGLRERGGKDTHKFLGFAAVAARRGQLVRAPALLLVPGPAAGSQAPAGRLHVQVRAGC